MDSLHSLFTELLELEAPFRDRGLIEKEKDAGKVSSMTFTIEIDNTYRPSKFHNIHSYYEKI